MEFRFYQGFFLHDWFNCDVSEGNKKSTLLLNGPQGILNNTHSHETHGCACVYIFVHALDIAERAFSKVGGFRLSVYLPQEENFPILTWPTYEKYLDVCRFNTRVGYCFKI